MKLSAGLTSTRPVATSNLAQARLVRRRRSGRAHFGQHGGAVLQEVRENASAASLRRVHGGDGVTQPRELASAQGLLESVRFAEQSAHAQTERTTGLMDGVNPITRNSCQYPLDKAPCDGLLAGARRLVRPRVML